MYPVPENRGKRTAMFLLCFVLFFIQQARAQCIASGPNSPATSSSVSFSGSDYPFNDPSNALSDDKDLSVAASVFSLFNKQTEYLQVKDFGFSIPTAATICGIEVTVVKSAANVLLNLASVTDYDVRIIKSNALAGTNKADADEWSSSDTYFTYGGVNDLWGTTWSPAEINSNTFGFSIAGEIETTVALFPSARIDHISMTVYYLDPSVLPAQSIQFNVANASNNTAMISWKQSSFDETTSFIVERSANGLKWEAVNGNPQKNSTASLLTFTDNRPLSGKSYYRLKIMTAEGNTRYTMSQPFELTNLTSLTCYPNPFTSVIQVKGIMAGERVAVTNMYGQRLYLSAPAVTNVHTIDIDDLQPGIYFISVGNRKIKVQKK
jgi:hypothetical protein